jgi:hypothetical protein
MQVTSTGNVSYQQLDSEAGISYPLQEVSVKYGVPSLRKPRREQFTTWLLP